MTFKLVRQGVDCQDFHMFIQWDKEFKLKLVSSFSPFLKLLLGIVKVITCKISYLFIGISGVSRTILNGYSMNTWLILTKSESANNVCLL